MNTPTDQEYSNLLQQREPEYAREAVERFVRRFEPSYRKLVYYAALPLVLTPELLHYLREHFLRREQVPWTAEVDLLLSELCREVGYELYAMETAVRAHALQELRKQPGGAEQMRGVAWLLLSYVQQLARHPAVSRQELEAQQWAAMAYLQEKRAEAVGEIVTALRQSVRPAVVLIDEIDKADIDFPNDLLTVLDQPWEFRIQETGETITAARDSLPIVIITSNKEKGNLPAPFLRRCVYHFLHFPDEERLKKIVEAHYHDKPRQRPVADLLKTAIERFLHLRRESGLHKAPATSEFLDWVHALQNFASAPYLYTQLADANAALPYPELLFKLRADWPKKLQE